MIRSIMRKLSRNWLARRIWVPLFRVWIATSVISSFIKSVLHWLWSSREHTNWTYDLTPHNLVQMTEFLHSITEIRRENITEYIDEILGDEQFISHIREQVKENSQSWATNKTVQIGRRIGWYVLVRSLKPQLVIESGIDKGLGTCVLAAAALRNQAEGSPTRIVGLDINPDAGWLVGPPYSDVVELVFSNSHDSLKNINEPIGMFIHDSYHTGDHEAKEYQLIKNQLHPGAIVISDNAHVSPAIVDFAKSLDTQFHYWQERPEKHFYSGAGIGIVITPQD
jgi:predicted O-methyltransferase YrrM